MADLTPGIIPVATGAAQIDDSHYADNGDGNTTISVETSTDDFIGSPGLKIVYAGSWGGMSIIPTSDGNSFIDLICYSGSPQVNFFNSGGTVASPSPTPLGAVLGELGFLGTSDTLNASGYGANIVSKATQAFDTGKAGSQIILQTCQNDSDTLQSRLVIDGFGNTNIENGHINIINTAPEVTSDVGTPTLDATASDNAGLVTVGDASTTTTVTFANPFDTAPHVVISNPDGTLAALTYTVTPFAIVVTYTLNTGGTFAYIAIG